ncbi:DUF302 domain-containing protein [Microbacterium sp. DT81.1]|uniref:DUF302 domain-containing protein n=1 Tax=Microbacterium sp. DT81.1 TaxID=3393413 RepID=UPI003CF92FA1
MIDHADAARDAGLALPDEVVAIFGNPALGTKLMQHNARAGIDLPLRILIWMTMEPRSRRTSPRVTSSSGMRSIPRNCRWISSPPSSRTSRPPSAAERRCIRRTAAPELPFITGIARARWTREFVTETRRRLAGARRRSVAGLSACTRVALRCGCRDLRPAGRPVAAIGG